MIGGSVIVLIARSPSPTSFLKDVYSKMKIDFTLYMKLKAKHGNQLKSIEKTSYKEGWGGFLYLSVGKKI